MNDDWRATYRLQLHAGFPLRAAAQLLPYLARLGVSHVYLSPCLQAVPGSSHGYDLIDPTRISDDLGGEEAWRSFQTEARAHGLGILLDIVPNHMSASEHNPWWEDVLAHGPASRYLGYFDIVPDRTEPRWRLHLAVLGRPYGTTLAAGELRVTADATRPRLEGPGQSWPLRPSSWRRLLSPVGAHHPVFAELAQPAAGGPADEKAPNAYQRNVEVAEMLWQAESETTASRLDQLNCDPERLHELLEEQWYALHHWKLQGEVTNYRRFFDVGSLAGLRMEDNAVFQAVHQKVAALTAAHEIQGLRVDHPDGLRYPRAYFERLRELLPAGRIYVEKILGAEERLRTDWPVDGTVGYDFLGTVNRLWMDERTADELSSIYADFTGHMVNLPRVVREKKAEILAALFETDLERLAGRVADLADASWRTRDLSREQLRSALALVTSLLPVYRTYRNGRGPDPVDRTVLTGTMALARTLDATIERGVFDFLEEIFLAENPGPATEKFIARWQQLTPAVAAKGVEDTAFYCYDRLVACNEVGAQASLLGISSEKFHEFCHHLHQHWPDTLLATSTHDNKRSEDVRTRISVLTEDTGRWSEALQSWAALNLPAWRGRAPDRHLEYLLYQTLVGAWPIDEERAWNYLLKASREAKIQTSWREPNAAYERAIRDFLAGIYASPAFRKSLEEFVTPLVRPGRINSLAQTLIKLTAPGVPDFYQGTELWDLSLVDPDNRRPVDFAGRHELQARLENADASVALRDWDSGAPKLWLIARTLALRRAHPEWFARDSGYQPVVARGPRVGHLLGFVRGDALLTVVPRFTYTLRDDWGETRIPLPPGTWKNWLGDGEFSIETTPGELFAAFPAALLVLQS
jgi:(1->4)-alpha-D-glucan 1-alpha-D-glucosylmutase